jgi:hypothetical protein
MTAYPPDGAALVRLLDEGPSYRIGRASECELRIEHGSVSRFHAEITGRGGAWNLRDTGSKNGLRVDGHLVLSAELDRTTWFSIGDVHCAFEPVDDAAAAVQRASSASRRDATRALSARLRPGLGVNGLIPQTLDVVLQLSGLERGFVLYADAGEPLRVRASRGLRASDFAGSRFSGSATAVERSLASGASVVCCDTEGSPWLGLRPSVRLGGIRALFCVPLAMSGGASGVIYADSRHPGPPVTDLDLELVQNVALHAASAIEAARIAERVAGLMATIPAGEADAPLWDELRQAIA